MRLVYSQMLFSLHWAIRTGHAVQEFVFDEILADIALASQALRVAGRASMGALRFPVVGFVGGNDGGGEKKAGGTTEGVVPCGVEFSSAKAAADIVDAALDPGNVDISLER